MPATRDSSHPLKVATPGAGRSELITRAAERARAAGARIELVTEGSFRDGFESCDVVVSLAWPPYEAPLTPALAGMAAGRTVVTLEVEVTAQWPALDPQTWSTRGLAGNARPIAVTIDPRDEEHSLMLALRRLATDGPLRQQLGRAAHDWWRTHATPAHSAAAWAAILEEAASTAPPARPRDWPQHLGADGMELTRAILAEYGRTLDI
jgi:hypothetical protein